jgi:uncharacterized membrane protein
MTFSLNRLFSVRRFVARLLVGAAVAASWSAAKAQSFTGIGFLSGGTSSHATNVSADASTVVGFASSPSGTRAIRWTREGGIESLGFIPGGLAGALAFGVSADGSVVVGSCYPFAFRWTRADGMQSLGRPPNSNLQAYAVNYDGSVVVGQVYIVRFPEKLAEYAAFRWTSAGGLQVLPDLPDANNSGAFGVSGDGLVIAGRSGVEDGDQYTSRLARWTGAGDVEDLGTLPGSSLSGYAVSGDGLTIVGEAWSLDMGARAIRWTRAGGIQDISDSVRSTARAVNHNGRVVVGEANNRAALWHANLGRFDIDDYLFSHGIDTDGWMLSDAWGVSSDGLTIVGLGRNPQGLLEGWVATLPACPADFNRDSSVNSQDFFDFLTAFFVADPAADFNADGVVNSGDFFAFLDAFFAGCP